MIIKKLASVFAIKLGYSLSKATRWVKFRLRHMYGSSLYLSTGNKKLKSTKRIKFLIWNIPACFTCPFRTAHCEKDCYACKAEQVYSNVLPCRLRNYNASQTETFVRDMVDYIESFMGRKSYQKAEKVVVRIHESGDFYSREYWLKWVAICNALAHHDNLVFMAYTKSVLFIKDRDEIPSNMTVRGSIWDDTPQEVLDKFEKLQIPVYTAETKEVVDIMESKGWFRCTCECCSTCEHPCWDKTVKKTVVVIH